MSVSNKGDARGMTDGRTLRAEENRRKVAQAMLELVREGVMQPTREQVAGRACLSLRSVYHHFSNMEDLYQEMCRIQFHSIDSLVSVMPAARNNQLVARIEAFTLLRAELYERITPVRHSAMVWIYRSTTLADGIAGLSERMREQLLGTFQNEFQQADISKLEPLLDAVEAATSWEAWDFMRVRKGFSRDRTQRAMAMIIDQALRKI